MMSSAAPQIFAVLALVLVAYKIFSLFARAIRLVISLAVGLGGPIAFHHISGWLGR